MLPFAHFLMGSSSRAPGRLLWETADVAEGETGCGVQDQRRILRVPSTGWKHGWLGAFCSRLHPAPLLLKKGRDRRGLAVPPISCSSHDTASAARAGPALSRVSCYGRATHGPRVLEKFFHPKGTTHQNPTAGRENPALCASEKKKEKQSCKCPSRSLLSQADHADPMQTDCDPSQSPPQGVGLSHWPQSARSLKKEKRFANNKQNPHPTSS